MLDYILIAVGLIIVVPILVYHCMKSGTVGFYRGKEVWKSRNEFTDSVQDKDENENES